MRVTRLRLHALGALMLGTGMSLVLASACTSDKDSTVDGGSTQVDGGSTVLEGGAPATDAGAVPTADTGAEPTADTGAVVMDAASPQGDAGAPPTDGSTADGAAAVDAAPSDAGRGSWDAAQAAVATFVHPVSDLTGRVDFAAMGSSVMVMAHVSGATPGLHGMHIHVNGICSHDTGHADAGGHWNPLDASHACPPTTPGHKGDFGNIGVDDAGNGMLTLTIPDLAISEIVGRAVIVHASPDDCTTQPTGNSGARAGCAVIEAQ